VAADTRYPRAAYGFERGEVLECRGGCVLNSNPIDNTRCQYGQDKVNNFSFTGLD
jgi:hypothetical protein